MGYQELPLKLGFIYVAHIELIFLQEHEENGIFFSFPNSTFTNKTVSCYKVTREDE